MVHFIYHFIINKVVLGTQKKKHLIREKIKTKEIKKRN